MVINTAIQAQVPQRRSTYSSDALDAVRQMIIGSVPSRGGNTVIIYVTNDVSQDTPRSKLMNSAEQLKATGAYIYAFGIGDQVSPYELSEIGTAHYFVSDYATLASSTQAYVSAICVSETTTTSTSPSSTTTTATTTTTSAARTTMTSTTAAMLLSCSQDSDCSFGEYCDASQSE